MKITKTRLKQLIKEELDAMMAGEEDAPEASILPEGDVLENILKCLQAAGDDACVAALTSGDIRGFLTCISSHPDCLKLLRNY